MLLLLPIGGIVLLRLYESALIRDTESELIAQGVVIVAAYRHEVRGELSRAGAATSEGFGRKLTARPTGLGAADPEGRFAPMVARLSLATDPVLAPAPDPVPSPRSADPVAAAAGQNLTRILREAQNVTLAGLRIVDAEGIVVASTGVGLGDSIAGREEVAEVLRGNDVRVLRRRITDEPSPPLDSLSRTTRVRVVVLLPVVEGDRLWGAVLLTRTPMSVAQSLYGIRWHIAAGVFAQLAAVLLISLFTSLTVTGPVQELIEQAERVSEGDRAAAEPLARPGTHEVGKLSEAVARMADVLARRADYIRSFASSVSHEFKTPLTAIRGTVELLRDHLDGMTAAERERFLANLDADAERLERLTGRLLELARAEVISPGDAASVVADVVARFAGEEAAAGRPLTTRVDCGRARARMADATLDAILRNLVDNGRRHGGEGATVSIGASPGPDGRVTLRVEDDGPGISPANLGRVFDAFFTTARATGGTGLGLPIVRALLEAHGGAISVTSAPGRTVFEVQLSAAAAESSGD